MSLADSLLAELDGLSDGEDDAPSPGPSASNTNGTAKPAGPGLMLPPPLPLKAKRLADTLDASLASSSKRVKLETNGYYNGADGDEDEDENMDQGEGGMSMGYVPEGGVRPADELDEEEVNQVDLTGVEDVRKVAKLLSGNKLKELLAVSLTSSQPLPKSAEVWSQDISRYTAAPSDMSTSSGPLEENREYSLVVAANNLSVEVENEILIVHKFIRDHYHPRFPELEQLIADPWTYVAAVKAMANADDLTRCLLPTTLPAATTMAIHLTATTTKSRKLTAGEWATVERATDAAHELRIAREQIFTYVESRMAAVAPNLSAIVGTAIAAKLLGLAGGLQAFSRQPACNVMLFGAQKRTLANSHLSAASQQRHTGFIFQSSIVQSAQPEDRRRAQRAVSAKVVLAARIDAGKGARDGSQGRKWLGELQTRIEKMAAPPPNKMTKALPIPQETIRKKRGGKRSVLHSCFTARAPFVVSSGGRGYEIELLTSVSALGKRKRHMLRLNYAKSRIG